MGPRSAYLLANSLKDKLGFKCKLLRKRLFHIVNFTSADTSNGTKLLCQRGQLIAQNERMLFWAKILHCKAILGQGQPGLTRLVTPLVQDRSLNLLLNMLQLYYGRPKSL